MNIIPLSVPRIEGNAWKYVKECLDTEWVSTAGPFVGRFEGAVAKFTGAPHAVAAVNGTAALHAALLSLGVGPGDGVLTPALTFIATANAVRYCGAIPVFVDCDPSRFNMDLDRLEEFLEAGCRRRGGRLVTKKGGVPLKAILPAHILGYPVNMRRLMALARRHRLLVLEDAAESLGSRYEGRHTGVFGHAGVLSFNGNKVITSGGGGMILTADGALARRARHLTTQAKTSPDEYIHDEVGYNYRLTNVSAALGLSQIELLPRFLAQRARIAAWYRENLTGVAVEPEQPGALWNRWLLAVKVPNLKERDRLLNALNAAGCQARALWRPVPMQKPYAGALGMSIPESRRAYETVVNIPSSSSLTRAQAGRVCAILRRAPVVSLLA